MISKIIISVVIVAVILLGAFFVIKMQEVYNVLSNSQATLPNINQTPGGKLKTNCAKYIQSQGKNTYKPGDTTPLPKDIVSIGSSETICGSVPSFGTVYYLTDKDDAALLELYREKLTARGCTIENTITPAPGHIAYAISMLFKCNDGNGYVSTGFKVNTFFVTFNLPG